MSRQPFNLSEQVEFDSIRTPDGKEYFFNNHGKRFVMSITGYGIPPLEYTSQRGPFQHGDSIVDFFLRPRTITLVHRRNTCSRQEYWNARAELLDFLRPNRQTSVGAVDPFQLRKVLPDGTIRDINVFIGTVPAFTARIRGQWDEWSYVEPLQFIAHNPLFFNPTPVSTTISLIELNNLVFPFTFDTITPSGLIFGSVTINTTQNITYLGTWQSFPTIVLTGPLAKPTIINTVTGDKIQLNYTIAAGEVVTIILEYGSKTIKNALGTNLIGTLTTDSDLATFSIEADPLAPLGVNPITFTGSAATFTTSIVLKYFERYIGI